MDARGLGEELKSHVGSAVEALVAQDRERSEAALASMLKRVQDLVERKRRMEGSKTDTRDLVMELLFSSVRQAMHEFAASDPARVPQRAAEWVMGSLYSMATLTELSRAFDQVLLRSSHGNQDFNFASRTDFLSLEEVLQMLAAGKHCGCLSLEKADNRLDIYMRDGRIVYLDPHHLTRRVIPASDSLHQRELPAAAVEVAEAERTRSGRPIVLALFDSGHFRKDELREMLRLFGREALYEFLIEDGPVVFYYRRQDKLPAFADEHDMRIGITSVLLEGSKRVDDWRSMRKMFPDAAKPVEPSGDMFARMGDVALDVLEIKLLSQVNGTMSPKGLVAVLGLPLFEVYLILVRLAREGIIVGAVTLDPTGGTKLSLEQSMQEAFAALDANDDQKPHKGMLDAMLGDGKDKKDKQEAPLRMNRGATHTALDSVFGGGKPAARPAPSAAPAKPTKPPESNDNKSDKQDFLSILKRSRPDQE